jgi:hypothetical protein
VKITRRQLRRIIRETIKDKKGSSNVDLNEGLFGDLTNMIAKKFGKIGKVSNPKEEKDNLGQAISRYITSIIKASKDDEGAKGKSDADIKGGAVEAAKSAVQEIISAWEKGGN